MCDIKNTLLLLCQHLKLSVNADLKPEYFRSAKFNNAAENVAAEFWKLLATLGLHALKEKGAEVDFLQYDIRTNAKLCFAYLQYAVVDFYSLPEDSSESRQLLLAFAWLLGTENALSTVVRINLVNSSLAKECSSTNLPISELKENASNSLAAEVNRIIHLSNEMNNNMKEISELVSEKTKLACKVHAASVNVSGLPHLSVTELALLKSLSGNKKQPCPAEFKNRLEELSSLGNLLDIHTKWLRKEHIFFDWMLTVVQEQNKLLDANVPNDNWKELVKFMVLLHRVIKHRVENETLKNTHDFAEYKVECVSRLLRTENGHSETAEWSEYANNLLCEESDNLRRKKDELAKELKGILKLIPSCVQIQ